MSYDRVKLKVKITNCFGIEDGSDVYWLEDEEGNKYSWVTKKILNKISDMPQKQFFSISANNYNVEYFGRILLKNVRILKEN